MIKVFVSIFTVLSYLIIFSYWTLGGVSYLWSLYIAYQESGIIGSVITMFLPVIGQVYWVYKVWSDQGFESMFVFISVAAVVTYIISLLLMFLLASLSKIYFKEDEEKREIFIYGFGGWLYVLILTQAYSVYTTATGMGGWFYYFSSEDASVLRTNGYNDYADKFAILGLTGLIYSLFLISIIILSWFFALRVSRHYKTTNIVMILGNFIGSIFLACFMHYLNAYTSEEIFESTGIVRIIIGSVIFGLIWLPYFYNSKRVANTFTR